MKGKAMTAALIVAVCAVCLPTFIYAQPMDFPSELQVSTTATFVNPSVPSSRNDSFRVTFFPTNPTRQGRFTFRSCMISGAPASRAIRVGNCKWTEFYDKGHQLLLFTFNWQASRDLGTSATWGQFCLLNTSGQGQWVRFFTSDGTPWNVVGSASGSLTHSGSGGGPGGGPSG